MNPDLLPGQLLPVDVLARLRAAVLGAWLARRYRAAQRPPLTSRIAPVV